MELGILMTAYGFYPMISKATRKQKQTETLLDNIFINNIDPYQSSGLMIEDMSDHLPVYLSLKMKSSYYLDRKTITVFDERKKVSVK